MSDIYVVVVKHNIVTALKRIAENANTSVPPTKLEIGTRLAENYRIDGCIDGEYYFDNAQRAKIFATLCLEFTRALVDKRIDVVKALAIGAEYNATRD
ncbi:MAG: hypothetical protein M3007_07900 [Candidatus Eremiobacteraeota bacterium]|nr:hypothetical protein [Candidatus Eremiobacteraeota bacterium]